MSKIHIIHENPAWLTPLATAFTAANLPFADMMMDSGVVDMATTPPEGVFFSRMSASSYTRDHQHSPDYCFALFDWLQAHQRRVINGTSVLLLELNKINQYVRLQKAGLNVPHTIACFGKSDLLAQVQRMPAPFVIKPNRGGKGIGVQLFHSVKTAVDHINSPDFIASVDNITLLQQYIQAATPTITRLEFINYQFVYAVSVDTSQGFELCPADACRIDEPKNAVTACGLDAPTGLFEIMPNFHDPIIPAIAAFLRDNHIEVAGVEFIRDKQGTPFVYDINTNTNYNPEAEAKAGISALPVLIDFLRCCL